MKNLIKKKYIYIQNDSSSCGICSIASIISFYNGYVPLIKIREDVRSNKDGTNAYMMIDALKKYGFNSYGLKCSLNNIDLKLLPCIAHVIKNGYEHFLVIYGITKEKVITMDPEYGKKIYSKEEFLNIFNNIIIISKPNTKILKMEKKRTLKKTFLKALSINKFSFIKIYILNIFIIILSLIINFYLKLLLVTDTKYFLTKIYIIILVLLILFSNYKDISENVILNKLNYQYNKNLINHLFKIKIEYLRSFKTGELVEKISNVLLINDLLIKLILNTTMNILLFFVSIFILYFISNKLFYLILIILLVYLIYIIIYIKKIYTYEIKNIESYNIYSAKLTEYISGIDSIKNTNKINFFNNNLLTYYKDYIIDNYNVSKIKIFNKNIINFILELGVIFVNLLGVILIQKGLLNLIELITFNTIFTLAFNSYNEILGIIPDIVHVRAIYDNTSEFLDVLEEREGNYFKEPFKELKVNNLNYTYDYIHEIFNNLNLNIQKGDKVLLMGKSGIGKSTLAKCIIGELDDYKGNISINDSNITKLGISNIRDYICYVGQNEVLYSMSIKDNICLGNYDRDKYNRITEFLELDMIFNKKMNKENTVILENGNNLSQGEKARIILGRALYSDKKILIIDETLSSINRDLEDTILKKLLLLDELTLIYITHRDKKNMFTKIINL